MTQAPATPELVERLRDERHVMQGDGLAALLATTSEAAAALEAQQARIAELEKALRFYANAVVASQHPDRLGACDDGWAARQALSSQGRHEGGEG